MSVSEDQPTRKVISKKTITEQFQADFRGFLIDAIVNSPTVLQFLKEAEETMDEIDMTVPLGTIMQTEGGSIAVSALCNLRDTVVRLKAEHNKLSTCLTEMGNTELLHLCAHIANKSGELKHVCPTNEVVSFWFNVDHHALVLQSVLDNIQGKRLPVKQNAQTSSLQPSYQTNPNLSGLGYNHS